MGSLNVLFHMFYAGMIFIMTSYMIYDFNVICYVTQPTQTSSGRLKKVTTSFDQTRRRQDIWQKTSDLRLLEDVRFMSPWRRPIYDVLKTSVKRCFEDIWFTTSWRRPIYVVLRTSNLRCLQDVWFMTSWGRLITTPWRRPIYVVWKTSNLRRLQNVCKTTFV